MACLGQRYFLPCAGTGAKTGRRYAAILSQARRVAARGKPFTRLDLAGLTADQGAQALGYLWKRGELRRLKAGRAGRGIVPGVYQFIM